MRLVTVALLGFWLGTDIASAQSVAVTQTPPAGQLPKYRPVLLSIGPKSLINAIDRYGIGERSQEDQAVMFDCIVNRNGKVISSASYRGTPGSDFLEQEILKHLETSVFIPALCDSKPVDAIYFGTATFSVVNGRPRLRIFSNQENNEVKAENDFIGPQPYFGGNSKFLGLHYPKSADGVVNGLVELAMRVDENGNVKEMSVAYEYPSNSGFGDAAILDFTGAKFIPAFRDGRPVECAIRLPVYYKAKGSGTPNSPRN